MAKFKWDGETKKIIPVDESAAKRVKHKEVIKPKAVKIKDDNK